MITIQVDLKKARQAHASLIVGKAMTQMETRAAAATVKHELDKAYYFAASLHKKKLILDLLLDSQVRAGLFRNEEPVGSASILGGYDQLESWNFSASDSDFPREFRDPRDSPISN